MKWQAIKIEKLEVSRPYCPAVNKPSSKKHFLEKFLNVIIKMVECVFGQLGQNIEYNPNLIEAFDNYKEAEFYAQNNFGSVFGKHYFIKSI